MHCGIFIYYNDLVDTFIPSKTIKPGKRHGQPWTRYKSVTKAKKNRRKKWVKFKRSGLFADELLCDQEDVSLTTLCLN